MRKGTNERTFKQFNAALAAHIFVDAIDDLRQFDILKCRHGSNQVEGLKHEACKWYDN